MPPTGFREPVLSAARSAVANAEHNVGCSADTIASRRADQGPRFQPRAQGRAYQIRVFDLSHHSGFSRYSRYMKRAHKRAPGS